MNTKLMLRFVFIISGLTVFLLSSCNKMEKDENNEGLKKLPNTKTSDELIVKYGESYNMAVNYHLFSVEISDTIAIAVSKSFWDETVYPQKSCSFTISQSQWDTIAFLANEIDFSKLDTIYGCPDCCDGGAGILEVTKNGFKNKVMLDLQLAIPDELKGLTFEMKKILVQLPHILKTQTK